MFSRGCSQLRKHSVLNLLKSNNRSSFLKPVGTPSINSWSNVSFLSVRTMTTQKSSDEEKEDQHPPQHARITIPSRSRKAVVDGQSSVKPEKSTIDDTEVAEEVRDEQRASTRSNPHLERGDDAILNNTKPKNPEADKEEETRRAEVRDELRKRLLFFVIAILTINITGSYLRQSVTTDAASLLERRGDVRERMAMIQVIQKIFADGLLSNAGFVLRKVVGGADDFSQSFEQREAALVEAIQRSAGKVHSVTQNHLLDLLRAIEAMNQARQSSLPSVALSRDLDSMAKELDNLLIAESKQAGFKHPARFAGVPAKDLLAAYRAEEDTKVTPKDTIFFQRLLTAVQELQNAPAPGQVAGRTATGTGMDSSFQSQNNFNSSPKDSFAITLDKKTSTRDEFTISGFDKAPESNGAVTTAYDPLRRATETSVTANAAASPTEQRAMTLAKLELALKERVAQCQQAEEAARVKYQNMLQGTPSFTSNRSSDIEIRS